MARLLNEKEYAQHRNEILTAAQRFIYTKGYEQMTIQDILDDLKISKGAFYHYFASKSDLLEGLIDQVMQAAGALLQPILNDPQLTALEKLQRYFDSATRWKLTQKDYMLAILRVWYTDENAIVRQKLVTSGIRWLTPMIAPILEQGTAEGVFHTPHLQGSAEVIISLMEAMGETIGLELLALLDENDATQRVGRLSHIRDILNAYTVAIERILGAPDGSVHLMDLDLLEEWLTPSPAVKSL
jgi:AcrR family transcriptional regulator